MLCANPIVVSGLGVVGCGQCIPCRINKRREWVHRLMLEASLYSDNSFITLTYDEEHLPLVDSLPTLKPKDLQDWLKRFRKNIEPHKVRYYAVGEYGDDTERPHFHIALFNYPSCQWGETRTWRKSCCYVCDMVRDTWGMGNVYLGSLSPESMNYVAGYVLKKMTRPDDIRLNGRHPEFARMSLRPGIGADAMHDAASTVLQFNLVEREGDVPSALRHGSRILPLGRYLRRKLRLLSTGTMDAPDVSKKFYEEEYARLRALQFSSPRAKTSIKSVKIEEDKGKVNSAVSRSKIFKSRKTL